MREVRWERMFPDELESAWADFPVAYFSYGLCEPHGPQNAVGLDALKAHALCCRTASEYGGIVAPPDYWHIHEIGLYASWGAEWIGEARPWLTAVPPWIHFKNICYHLRAADALEFHASILLTGHYGPNWKDLKTMVELLQPHFSMRIRALPDFEANQPGFDGDGATGDHAGKVETSLLWALEPSCVDVSRFPDSSSEGPHFAMGPDAHNANRRIGERMVADEVSFLGAMAKDLLEEYDQSASRNSTPVSFIRLEEIWADEIAPRLAEFESMKYDDRTPPSSSSRWRLNLEVPKDIPIY